jgi:hypothetical protein
MDVLKPKAEDCNTNNNSPPTSASPITKPKAGWRSWLRVHPLAEFPPLAADELSALAADMKKNGQREPVSYIRDAHGPILLDGCSRLDARELAGKKINIDDSAVFQRLSDKIDVAAFVISANIHRRHLTAEKKRELIGKLLKAKPETSNLQIAKQVKADDKTVEKVRNELERRSEIPNVATKTDTKGRVQPAKKGARSTRTAATAAPHQPLKVHTQTLIDRWDHATPDEQIEFVKARRVDILRVQQKLDAAEKQLWVPEDADDALQRKPPVGDSQ